jgi:hypothetical protein
MEPFKTYYPNDGSYMPIPTTIYAYFRGAPPNPCRKYHVSSDVQGAERVAEVALSYLAEKHIFHKVVQHSGFLTRQTAGTQAGKFITLYMNSNVAQINETIINIGSRLAELKKQGHIRPCPRMPKSRRYRHLFIEQPLDEEMFIYGGFICDPGA